MLKFFKRAPVLIAFGVIVLVCLARWARLDFFERLERMTYDMRVRQAAQSSPPSVTNLGCVFIDDESVRKVQDGSLGFRFGLLWPRQVYGRLVNELSIQGAQAVAFDIVFGELRNDHPPVRLADGSFVESDQFFALQMQRASNVIVAVTRTVTTPSLFLTNASAIGDITTDKDADGILRRVQVFRTYTNWHEQFRAFEARHPEQVNLDLARLEPGAVVLPCPEQDLRVALDADGNFDLTNFLGSSLPPGAERKAKPFTLQRVWQLGVALAARQLNLDLDAAEMDLAHGRIILRGPGVERVVPVDAEGCAYIDWGLPPDSSQLSEESIQSLLLQNYKRLQGQTNGLNEQWRGKLVVVGSSAQTGNNLTDRGATPLAQDTILVSKHWNVANSILTGRFVKRSGLLLDLVIIVLLGIAAGRLSWSLPVLRALNAVVLLAVAYTLLGVVLYLQTRYWIPLVLPVLGVMLVNYACIATYRVVFEDAGRRRVKAVLSTMVSPKVANVLLQAPKLSLGGARREISVLFADVRGFTGFTDIQEQRASDFVSKKHLTGPPALAHFDEQARETLATINLYLGLMADTLLKHDGTWDKFIGDCVMAFWGAPNPEPRHAVACVRAAIEAQQAIAELNRQRAAENKLRELQGSARAANGLEPQPLLPLLFMGTGINTGFATVGIMGSGIKEVVRQGNYTVFGREVNLASRLEALSGHGHILITDATYQHLLRDDPALAATCIAQPPAQLRGINAPVQIFEVPWRPPGAPPLEECLTTATPGS